MIASSNLNRSGFVGIPDLSRSTLLADQAVCGLQQVAACTMVLTSTAEARSSQRQKTESGVV